MKTVHKSGKRLFSAAAICLGFIAGGIFFASCSQEPIFAAIENETKLNKGTVKGNVYALVKSNNSLFAANGYLYRKDSTGPGGWYTIDRPAGRCIALAGTSDGLYAMNDSHAVFYNTDPGNGGWAEVTDITADTSNRLFSDGTDAYVRTGGTVYKLAAGGITNSPITANGASANSVAAAKLQGGNTFFSDSAAFTSNRNVAMLYRQDAGNIQYSSDGANWDSDPFPENTKSLAVWQAGGTDWLLAGTSSGYKQIPLNSASGVPDGNPATPGGNADPAIGIYEVSLLFTDPRPGAESVIYAGVIDRQNGSSSGLWAWFPSTAEWNRE